MLGQRLGRSQGEDMELDSASDDSYKDAKIDDTEEQVVLKIKERIGRLEKGRRRSKRKLCFLKIRRLRRSPRMLREKVTLSKCIR